MRESDFQKKLKRDIESRLPGVIIFKTDCCQMQGVPDLLLLYKDKWGMLEVKKSETASRRPNQPTRVDLFNKMSYASFVYPENKEDVLNDLERFFKV